MRKRNRVVGALVLGAAVALAGAGTATAGTVGGGTVGGGPGSGGFQQLALWPSSCTTTKDYNGGNVKCTSGGGTYQAVVHCQDGTTARGPWVSIGSTSWAFCKNGLSKSVSYNVRSD